MIYRINDVVCPWSWTLCLESWMSQRNAYICLIFLCDTTVAITAPNLLLSVDSLSETMVSVISSSFKTRNVLERVCYSSVIAPGLADVWLRSRSELTYVYTEIVQPCNWDGWKVRTYLFRQYWSLPFHKTTGHIVMLFNDMHYQPDSSDLYYCVYQTATIMISKIEWECGMYV